MSVRDLVPHEGYDPASQLSVAHFAAQLTDQLGRLKEVCIWSGNPGRA